MTSVMPLPAIIDRDPSVYWHRCAHPADDSEIPDNRLITAHSLECDDIEGIAQELLDGWLQSDIASVQSLADRSDYVQGMLNSIVAYHCGNGNQHGTGHEMVGRAVWSFAQWTTPTMIQALHQQAKAMAWKWVHRTMPQYGLSISARPEWLSLAQVGDGVTCGLCTHNDMRLVYGGTTHTDPGPNFPYAMLRDFVHAECDALLGVSGGITGGGTGTTTPPADEDNMANLYDNTADFEAAVARAAAKGVTDALAPGAPADAKSLASRLQFWVWSYLLPNSYPDKGTRSGAGRILSNLGIASNPLATAVNVVKKALGK